MSSIDSAQTVAEEPARPRPFGAVDLLDRVGRVLLLLVVLAGTLGSVLPHLARGATPADLGRDLAAGRVAVTTYDRGTARWSADWWRWQKTDVPDPVNDKEQWLRDQVAASGRPVRVEELRGSSSAELLTDPPWPPLEAVLLGLTGLAFVFMLLRPRRWLATRWGWFWLFFAGIGAPLHLLLEPEPLWARPGRVPSRPRTPLSGLACFWISWLGITVVMLPIYLVSLLLS